jgi:hypothetical protein
LLKFSSQSLGLNKKRRITYSHKLSGALSGSSPYPSYLTSKKAERCLVILLVNPKLKILVLQVRKKPTTCSKYPDTVFR